MMPPLPPLNPPWSWRIFETGAYLLEAGWLRAGLNWTGLHWEVWLVRDPLGAELSVDGVRPERVHVRLEQLLGERITAPDWTPPELPIDLETP